MGELENTAAMPLHFQVSKCEFQNLDWVEGIGCVDGYIFLMEDLNDSQCTSNGFRTLSVNEDDSPIMVSSCYGSCGTCDN